MNLQNKMPYWAFLLLCVMSGMALGGIAFGLLILISKAGG